MKHGSRLSDKVVTLFKVAISLALIVYIFTRPEIQNADWEAIRASLHTWPWLIALVVYFVAIGSNVVKWQYLLRRLGLRVPFWSLFRHNLVGLFFANLPLSMVGADIARGWDLARDTQGQTAPIAVSVLVDRLVGLAAFLLASALGMAYAVAILGRADLIWLLGSVLVACLGFALGFAALMSQRLRTLVERFFGLGPLQRLLPTYQRLSNSVQVYRTHGDALLVALGLGLVTVLSTCLVNYLAALSVGVQVPPEWVLILTPLTAFAPFLPSVASGLGWNQGVFIVLYYDLAHAVPSQASALAMSLAMQAIILVASLPGGFLWWRKRQVPSQRVITNGP